MKKLICGLGLALGLSLSCHAQGMKISQYPNTATLTGTNLFIIAVGTTNKNISYEQLSNLLAAAIGGGGWAQVWTNDLSFFNYNSDSITTLRPVDFQNYFCPFFTNVVDYFGGLFPVTFSGYCSRTNDGYFSVFFAEPNGELSSTLPVTTVYSVAGYALQPQNTNLYGAQAGYFQCSIPIFQNSVSGGRLVSGPFSGAEGVLGIVDAYNPTIIAGEGAGVKGVGGGAYSTRVGVLGYVYTNDTMTGVQTNVGIAGIADVNSGPTVAGLFSLTYTPISGVHSQFSALKNAVIISENNDTSMPLFIGSTNNGTVVASLGSSGVWTNNGNFYPSNAVASIPTAAALGAGGYWTGNSNGFLVTVYSLNGSTTVMKVLAP